MEGRERGSGRGGGGFEFASDWVSVGMLIHT